MSYQHPSYSSTIVSMARGAGIVFIGIFLSRILGYMLRILLKHVLGLETFGLLWSSYNIIEMVTFLCLLGIPNTLSRHIAFYKAQNNPQRVGGFIAMGFMVITPLLIFVTFLLFWHVDYFATTLFAKPDIQPFLKILSFGVLPLALMFIFGSIFRGFKLMSHMVFTQQLSRNVFMLFAFALLLVLGLKELAAWAMLLGLILTLVAAIFQFMWHVEKKYITNIELAGVFRELLHYSWPLVFTTLFWNMSGRIDIFFLTIYENESNVGVYNAILPLAQFVPVIMQSFISILMPIFSGIFAQYDRNALVAMQQAATKWIFAFTAPLFLLLIIFSDSILLILLGKDTVIGAIPLTIAASGYFINAAFGVLNIILNAAGRTKLTLLNTSVYIVLNILLDILLIPRYGLIGAAFAGACSMFALNIFAAIENYRLYNLIPLDRQILYISIVSIISGGVTMILKQLLPTQLQLVTIAVGSLLLILLYFGGLKRVHIFDQNDLAIITALEKKFGVNLAVVRRFIGSQDAL
ncbi:hypothetical protein EH223_17840 [candidate division KSB1 bacterium]|nr:oligosaccharide flippase family protein [candidate division KSB1 bacterium]RQW00611.1 MAG: hypothetical protein EH223_17840 [candidate division KSB1 bacterium]